MDLLAHSKRTDARVADAIITVLCRADASTLAALGLVFEFVALRAPVNAPPHDLAVTLRSSLRMLSGEAAISLCTFTFRRGPTF